MSVDTTQSPLPPLGTALVPVSHKYTHAQFRHGDELTIHNDDAAAQREGLPRAVATGPQVAALIFRMMRQQFGRGWVEGGGCSLTFRRPTFSDEFASARGRVTGHRLEGGRIRVECDVWVETERGEKSIVGHASALHG